MKKITLMLSLLMASIASAQPGSISIAPKFGLVASYSFDNPNPLNDSENVRNLSAATTGASVSTGKFGDAITLNGDYLTGADLTDSDAYTYSFWLKTSTNTTDEKAVIDDSQRPGVGFGSGFGTAIVLQNGKVSARARVFFGGGLFRVTGVTSTTLIADGNWHHIVIEVAKPFFNVVSSKITVDKVVEGTDQKSVSGSSLVDDFNTTGNFVIGNNRGNTVGANHRYSDEIDELKIYNTALPTATINSLFDNNSADVFEVNGIGYAGISANEVEAIGYTGSGTVLNIPNQVTYNGTTYSVTTISSTNFRDKNFTEVTIPNSVTTIGNNAFQNNDIVTLNLGTGVQTIGTSAFLNNELATLVIPNNVTTIGQNAFKNNQFSDITLGSGLTSIHDTAFEASFLAAGATMTSLMTNPVPLPNTLPISVIDLIIPTGTTARYTAAGWTGFRSITEIVIPGGLFEVNDIIYQIKNVGPNEVIAESYNGTTSPLVTLNISSQVTYNGTTYDVTAIANNAFSNLGIENLSLPNTLTSIGTAAFRDNAITGALTIPNGITSLPDNCFRSNNITSLTLPSGLNSIGTACFFDNNLTTLTIPNSVVTIGNNAFHDNSSLATLTLGTGVETIGTSAFLNDAITTLVIPNSVTTIGANAFKNNRLTEVTLGSGVNVIAAGAFSENTSISSVNSLSTSPANLTFTSGGLFNEGFARTVIDLLIPTGTTAAYTAAGWTGFKSVTEDTTLSSDTIALNNNVKFTVINNILSINTNNNVNVLGVAVYQLTGKQVLNTTNSTANINSLASGVYIVSITTDKGVVAKKIVKN